MMAAGAGHRAPSAPLYASGGGPAPCRRTGPRPDCGVGSGGGCRVELGEDVVERIVEPGEARRFLSSPIPTVHSATCDRGEGVAAGEEHGVTGGVRVEDAEEQMPGAEVDDARLGASSDVRRGGVGGGDESIVSLVLPICRAPRQRARRR
jgi:hypothetical protein